MTTVIIQASRPDELKAKIDALAASSIEHIVALVANPSWYLVVYTA